MTKGLRVAVVLVGMAGLPAFAAERWFLMGRHGECADVASLRRKVPELGAIRDPDGFVALMRQQGVEVSVVAIPLPRGQARELRVPARELGLVFVTAELCEGAGSSRE